MENGEEKNKNSRLSPTVANMKDAKQLLRYAEEAMKSDSYSYNSDINEDNRYYFYGI